MARPLGMLIIAMLLAAPVAAQERGAVRADYFQAVASFFNLPPNEIAILSDWQIPPDEIPVVLFVARRAGVSPEALVALRQSGRSWSALADQYRVRASAFHVPVGDDAPAGLLQETYGLFRSTPVAEWSALRLSDDAIVALVNVRVISQSLHLPAERVMAETTAGESFVDLYTRLAR